MKVEILGRCNGKSHIPAMNLHPGDFHRGSSRIPYIGQPNTGNKRGVQMHHQERERASEREKEQGSGEEHTADRTYLA